MNIGGPHTQMHACVSTNKHKFIDWMVNGMWLIWNLRCMLSMRRLY